MIIILQLLIFSLIGLSILLVISIPVTLALPAQWEQSKNLIYTGAGLWALLVIVTGTINSFII